MYIKKIKTKSEFNDVKTEWLNFEEKVNNKSITSSYIWQRTWWDHFEDYEDSNFGYNKELCILFLYNENNDLRAIAPFCAVHRIRWGVKCRTIEFIAQQWGATYLDFISEKLTKEEYDFIFNWLKKNEKYDLIDLQYIPEFSENFNLYKNNITSFSACPEMNLHSYDFVLENYYSKKTRKQIRRLKRKIENENINFNNVYLSSVEVLPRFEQIMDVSFSKELSSKHSIYRNPVIVNFIKCLIYLSQNNTICFFIDYNDKIAIYKLGFVYNGTYYSWDTAYNRNEKSISNISLNELCYDYLITSLIEMGTRYLSMGTGIDLHKFKITQQFIKIYTFLGKGNSLKGIFFYIRRKKINKKIEENFLNELKIVKRKDKKIVEF